MSQHRDPWADDLTTDQLQEAMAGGSRLHAALVQELGIHATSPTHQGACLCGDWDYPAHNWDEHLAWRVMIVLARGW